MSIQIKPKHAIRFLEAVNRYKRTRGVVNKIDPQKLDRILIVVNRRCMADGNICEECEFLERCQKLHSQNTSCRKGVAEDLKFAGNIIDD